jgi:hypothetical protein
MVRIWYREVEEGLQDAAPEELWDKIDQYGPEVEEKEKQKWRKKVEEEVENQTKTMPGMSGAIFPQFNKFVPGFPHLLLCLCNLSW